MRTEAEWLAEAHAVLDNARQYWLAFETEEGEWYAARDRHEDDEPGPEGDPWRPIGPRHLDGLAFPLRVVVAHEAVSL